MILCKCFDEVVGIDENGVRMVHSALGADSNKDWIIELPSLLNCGQTRKYCTNISVIFPFCKLKDKLAEQ